MTTSMIALVILLVTAVTIALRGPRWARLAVAAGIFGFQAFVLVISFDGAARGVMAERIQAGQLSPEFENGELALRSALLPYRLMLLASACGLLLLAAFPLKKKSD